MPRGLEQVLDKLPAKRRAKVQQRAAELATLKDLRHAVERTQVELAIALGVGQDTISRLEQRSDMLLSTLKRYVEAMGGKLDLSARFPNRPPVIIEQIAERRGQEKQSAKGPRIGKRHAVQVVRHCSFDRRRFEVRAHPQVGPDMGLMRCISMPRTTAVDPCCRSRGRQIWLECRDTGRSAVVGQWARSTRCRNSAEREPVIETD